MWLLANLATKDANLVDALIQAGFLGVTVSILDAYSLSTFHANLAQLTRTILRLDLPQRQTLAILSSSHPDTQKETEEQLKEYLSHSTHSALSSFESTRALLQKSSTADSSASSAVESLLPTLSTLASAQMPSDAPKQTLLDFLSAL